MPLLKRCYQCSHVCSALRSAELAHQHGITIHSTQNMLKASIADRRGKDTALRAKTLSKVVVHRIPRGQLPSPCRMRHEAAAEIAHHRRALRHLRTTRSHALAASKRHLEAADHMISQHCVPSLDVSDDYDARTAAHATSMAAVSEVPHGAAETKIERNQAKFGLSFSPAPQFGPSFVQDEEAARAEALQKGQQQRAKALPHGSGAVRFRQLQRRRSSSARLNDLPETPQHDIHRTSDDDDSENGKAKNVKSNGIDVQPSREDMLERKISARAAARRSNNAQAWERTRRAADKIALFDALYARGIEQGFGCADAESCADDIVDANADGGAEVHVHTVEKRLAVAEKKLLAASISLCGSPARIHRERKKALAARAASLGATSLHARQNFVLQCKEDARLALSQRRQARCAARAARIAVATAQAAARAARTAQIKATGAAASAGIAAAENRTSATAGATGTKLLKRLKRWRNRRWIRWTERAHTHEQRCRYDVGDGVSSYMGARLTDVMPGHDEELCIPDQANDSATSLVGMSAAKAVASKLRWCHYEQRAHRNEVQRVVHEMLDTIVTREEQRLFQAKQLEEATVGVLEEPPEVVALLDMIIGLVEQHADAEVQAEANELPPPPNIVTLLPKAPRKPIELEVTFEEEMLGVTFAWDLDERLVVRSVNEYAQTLGVKTHDQVIGVQGTDITVPGMSISAIMDLFVQANGTGETGRPLTLQMLRGLKSRGLVVPPAKAEQAFSSAVLATNVAKKLMFNLRKKQEGRKAADAIEAARIEAEAEDAAERARDKAEQEAALQAAEAAKEKEVADRKAARDARREKKRADEAAKAAADAEWDKRHRAS